jgi:putative membrane protein insertion efficiency factor
VSPFTRLLRLMVKMPIFAWRLISPSMAPKCRYLPTCSEYALVAIDRHGVLYGLWLGGRRILRCHPISWLGGGSGFDPVPQARHKDRV